MTTGSPGWIGPDPMSWPEALWAPWATMSASALAPPRATAARIASLIRSHVSALAVGDQPGAAGLGTAEQLDRRPHARLGGGLRPADPRQLGLALDAAAGLEQLPLAPRASPRRRGGGRELERELARAPPRAQPE